MSGLQEITKFFQIFIMGKIEKACPGIQRIMDSKSNRISKINIKKKNSKLYIDIIIVKACSIENVLRTFL